MKNKLSVLAIVLSVIALGSNYLPKHGDQATQQTQAKESTYDRIMRTKTIRCSYLVWPPYLNKDTATGKLSGVYFDLMERIGKDWGVTIDWAEEAGTASRLEGVRTGRTDFYCSASAPTPERTAVAAFSRAFVYHPFYLYVKEGDTRFDAALAKVNDPSISMLTLDGYLGSVYTKEQFPLAKTTSLPDLSTDIDILLGLGMGKADAAICDGVMAAKYIQDNPGQVRRVPGPPIRYSVGALTFPLGEPPLREKLDTTLTYYLDTGVIEKILTQNGLEPGKVLRVAKPYQD